MGKMKRLIYFITIIVSVLVMAFMTRLNNLTGP